MMILAVTVLATALSNVPASEQKAIRSVAPVCQQFGPRRAAAVDETLYQKQGRARTRRLGEEPAADVVATVVYTEGRCSKPIVISRDLGMNPKPNAKAR